MSVLNLFPGDGEYVCCRTSLTVDGTTLKKGKSLPYDSAIRNEPRRLRILIEQRKLRLVSNPVLATAAPRKKTVEEPVVETDADVELATEVEPESNTDEYEVPEDWKNLNKSGLLEVARELGLDESGTKADLRDRIEQFLGE